MAVARAPEHTPFPDLFHPAVRAWLEETFAAPTRAQAQGWPEIVAGNSTLILAPTGSGKTLAAFLAAIDRLMFSPVPAKQARCRVLYVSPLRALAFDVERNLRAPLVGIARVAERRGESRPRPDRRAPHRRHRGRRARPDAPQPAGHPDHHARVAVPDAHLAGPGDPPVRRAGHRRRDPHPGRHQARRAPGALAGAPGAPGRPADPARRPLRHAAPAGRGGALPAAASEPSPHPLPGERGADSPSPARERGCGVRGIRWTPRPVSVVDAGVRKAFDLRVEVPVEDMSRLGEAAPARPGRDPRRPHQRPAAATRSGPPSTRACSS